MSRLTASKAREAVLLLGLALLSLGCSQGGVREACLKLEASEELNFYSGQAHVTVVYLYPLESRLGFEQLSADELLAEPSPPGLVGSRLQVTIAPGERRDVTESLPGTVSQLGLVADFYRPPGESAGDQKVIVDARCGYRAPRLILSRRNLLLQ